MIRTEDMTIGGKAFVRTYSDSGRCVVRDGVSYDEAIDPAEFDRTYAEGEPMDATDAEEILDILLGGTDD